jgi:N-acetylmuramoyl-L-alanine amidase
VGKGATQAMKPVRIIIHCTATPNKASVTMDALRKGHLARGFSDIGYHKVIHIDGTVSDGRPMNVVGAHVEGANTGSIGIALVGTDRFTRAQFDALRRTLDGIFMTYSIPKQNLYCHYQFASAQKQGKTCPNLEINTLLLWYWNVIGEQAIAPYLA